MFVKWNFNSHHCLTSISCLIPPPFPNKCEEYFGKSISIIAAVKCDMWNKNSIWCHFSKEFTVKISLTFIEMHWLSLNHAIINMPIISGLCLINFLWITVSFIQVLYIELIFVVNYNNESFRHIIIWTNITDDNFIVIKLSFLIKKPTKSIFQ